MTVSMASYEPSAPSTGLVGIQFSPDKTEIDTDLNVLVTIHQVGSEDFSVLYNSTGVHRGVDASEYLDSATEIPAVVYKKQSWGILTYLAAFFAIVMVSVSVLGMAKVIAVRVVLTGSMVPAINPGDVIVTVNDKYREPQLNDVVVYIGKKFDGTAVAPFSHRIIGGDAANGWVVKGDANADADIQHPVAEDIDGVVVTIIPAIGRFLTPQILMLFGILAAGAWFILDWARSEDV